MNEPVLALSRAMFDVGVVTASGDAALAFWHDRVGLELVSTIEPVDGVQQHRFDLHGAVLKVNCIRAGGPSPRRGGVRLLTIASAQVDEPTHLADPDGNLVELVPEGLGVTTFNAHLAVSDEDAFAVFFGDVLGLRRVGDRVFEVDRATVSFSWSPDVHPGLSTGPLGFSYLTIQVLNAAQAHDALCARGAHEVSPPSSEHFATESVVSFIADPDGNRIEISQRPDLVEAHVARSHPRQ